MPKRNIDWFTCILLGCYLGAILCSWSYAFVWPRELGPGRWVMHGASLLSLGLTLAGAWAHHKETLRIEARRIGEWFQAGWEAKQQEKYERRFTVQ